ncbi:MAG: HD domain-containing protein [Candidatus Omnitrophica bacterium]|nr:HD domain-containing protein [Candidatus Omnitrophota bacterium]
MRKFGLGLKLSLLIVSLVVVLTSSIFAIYRRVNYLQERELKLRMIGMARIMSIKIEADKLELIKPEHSSESTAVFQDIKQSLLKLKNTSPLIDSVYTMVKSDKPDIWLFLVDSGDVRKAHARCGEAYDVSNFPDMRVAFDGPSVDNKFTQDKWGVFQSAYAPIYNKDGKAIAIIGLDVKAESILAMKLFLTRMFLGILILGIFISLLLGWFFSRSITRPINSLMLGVEELGKGNLEHKVIVKSSDELAQLAVAFNKMSAELMGEKRKLQRYYIETIKSLIRALEAKDKYTSGHSERVAHYAIHIAQRLGLPEKDIKLLEEVAALHDIGKIGMPAEILNKNGPLTKEEQDVVKQHPTVGEEILKPIEFLEPGLSAVRDHHERQDGTGYPNGIKGGLISIFAAIAAVADSYDAMTSDRPYRKALSKEEAINILEKSKGTQFNSEVVDAFVQYLESQKPKA